MYFSAKKKTLLREQKNLAFSTFLITFFMAAALFVPYMIADNGYFLFYGDFNVQQIPFYQHCHALIKSGNVGWDFGTDLGVNFVGSYTFYLLGSPFLLFTLLFPNNFVPYLIGPLLILKFSLAALTAYLYLSRMLRTPENARLGAILYAFSGFSVYNIFFNHFHEAIIIFPLLLLAFELLITENRRGIFALCTALAAITNYFFFFGMVVFIVIYWIVRLCSGAIKITVRRFLVLFLEALIGVALAAAWLLPAIAALSGNGRITSFQSGWGALLYGKEQIYANVLQCFFFPPDLPARPVFFPGADVKWSSLGGWLPVLSMVGVFAFLQQKKHHWLRRVIGIMIFMALVPILNSAFYMFNTAYYARWYYMPILLMCLATCKALEDREIEWQSPFRWVFSITLAVSLVIGFMPRGFEDGKITGFGIYTQDNQNVYAMRFWLYVLIAIIGLLLFRISLYFKEKSNRKFFKIVTCFVCAVSVLYSSLFIGLGKSHAYDSQTVMIDRLLEADISLPEKSDEFRIDCYECVDNTGMYLGYSTINAFHSIVPTSVTEFYKFIGEERGVASRPSTKSYAARSLLSVRYLFDMADNKHFDAETGHRMPGYTLLKTEQGYDIYENENYIPYGFTYDYYMSREDALRLGAENAPAMMLKALLLEPNDISKYKNYLKPMSDDYSFESGTGKEQVVITEETYKSDCRARAATAAEEFSISDDSFKAKVNLQRENLVFFSIPYDEGWSAYVNGARAEIVKANIGFMAVLAPEGESEIEFVYKTPALNTGIMVSLFTAAVFAGYLLLSKKYRKEDAIYPEGEELLAVWQEDEISETVILSEEILDNGEKEI